MRTQGEGALAEVAEVATGLIGRILNRRSGSLATQLDLAGLRMRPQDFVFLVIVVAFAVGALVLVLRGGWFALPVMALAPIGSVVLIMLRIRRRRHRFANHLDSTLQLLASSMRAGHSMMQSLAGVAQQSEEPTASELARVVNETRVGRPVVEALMEAAERMDSVDFTWAAQAIAINREVGGSLAEVLDGVSQTIRERGQIRRHVATLSAEGRMSAIILILLPFVVAGSLMVINPGYLAPLVESLLGIVLLIGGGLLLLVGSVWIAKSVEVKF
ncbi:type II secretion system F family protein [Agrococcus sp. KRD186]|uniref:type II secretion system F family protein n=1 Tax=Agrococcus sp. KRD186 TaxID=2729730 RepID=UPI0019D06E89